MASSIWDIVYDIIIIMSLLHVLKYTNSNDKDYKQEHKGNLSWGQNQT